MLEGKETKGKAERVRAAKPRLGILPHTTERLAVFVLFSNHLVQADSVEY